MIELIKFRIYFGGAAECRERAHTYEALATEAQKRGDTRLCIEFTSKAAEELVEASRIEGA